MDINKDRTVMERHSDNEGDTQLHQIETRLPPTQAVNELANEYKNLTDLMKNFEMEVGSFTGHMRQINNDVSNFAGLTKLWDEQVRTIDQEIKEFEMDIDPDKAVPDQKK